MSERKPDQLDRMLAKLDREVELERDLWPDIAATLNRERVPGQLRTENAALLHDSAAPSSRVPRMPPPLRATRLWQLAAVLLLMAASSAITYVLTYRTFQGEVLQARQEGVLRIQPVGSVMPASFGDQRLGLEYSRARAELDAPFARYVQTLPLEERVELERSLADLRRAAREIAQRLQEHPSDPLLHELLLSAYQSELGLLTRVTKLGAATGLGADL